MTAALHIARPLRWAFALLLLASLVAELFVELHPHFAFADWPLFHAVFALIVSVALVAISKLIGVLLIRRADADVSKAVADD